MDNFDEFVLIAVMLLGIFFVLDAVFFGFCFKKVFQKAKYKPGDAFIPLLNLYRITQIAGFPGWIIFVFLFFSSPGIFFWRILIAFGLHNAFKPDPLILVCLLISPPIGCLLLGRSNSVYLLDEEEIAKSQVKGFSSDSEEKK